MSRYELIHIVNGKPEPTPEFQDTLNLLRDNQAFQISYARTLCHYMEAKNNDKPEHNSFKALIHIHFGNEFEKIPIPDLSRMLDSVEDCFKGVKGYVV